MSVKVGTTISGTYKDGPGRPGQNHLVYAANAGVWWLFTVSSGSDTPGSPGTHLIKSYVSSGPDLTTATWSASTDSPNFDGSSTNTSAKLEGGYSLGCFYWNNAAGTNKDIVLISAGMQNPNKLDGGNSYQGIIRAVVTATAITWGNWGGYTTPAWNNVAGHTFQAGSTLGRTADGYIQVASMYLHSEVDAAVVSSLDPDTSDSWTEGNLTATGNTTNGNAAITTLSNQTRLKAGMALSYEAGDWTAGNRYPKVNTIDSGTQVTMNNSPSTTSVSTSLRWWQGSPGTNRAQDDTPMIDTSMSNECQCYGFAPLASNGMLCVYDTGAQVAPNFDNLSSRKANQTKAQGFWPATAAAGVDVFGATSTQDIQDWCLVGVDTTHIYCSRRTGNTTIATRIYNTGADTWSALGNQPPALTGKVIKAGGGVMGITDGIDLWLFVIDSTDNAIKYVKFTVALGTWGSWTLLESVDSTAKYLSGYQVIGGLYAGLMYAVTNGANFDTYVSTLQIAPSPPTSGFASTHPLLFTLPQFLLKTRQLPNNLNVPSLIVVPIPSPFMSSGQPLIFKIGKFIPQWLLVSQALFVPVVDPPTASPLRPGQPLLFTLRRFQLNAILPRGAITNLNDPIFVVPQPPKPLLFPLKGKTQVFSSGLKPLPTLRLFISGVTQNSVGAVLAGCTVRLYRTVDNLFMEQVVSDVDGAYTFSGVGLGEAYYIVAYKAGSPDVAGTSVNTLVGV